jgi:hypothetical protein
MRDVLLLAILMLAGLGLRGDPAEKNWAPTPSGSRRAMAPGAVPA